MRQKKHKRKASRSSQSSVNKPLSSSHDFHSSSKIMIHILCHIILPPKRASILNVQSKTDTEDISRRAALIALESQVSVLSLSYC